jgi:L-aspartate oxidase
MVPLLHMPHRTRDRVIVVGGGVAGLATALELAPLPVTVLVPSRAGTDAATAWAQGGIAAAIGEDDAPSLHAEDTLAAAAGLGDPEVARRVTDAAPAAIDRLIGWGVDFDREAGEGSDPSKLARLALGLEAAHSRRRIVHARGDGTGKAVIDALVIAARRTPSIEILEDARAVELALEDGAVVGVHAVMAGQRVYLPARGVVLATGGVGGLYERTTNPLVAVGSGLALAARAGAVLRDVEFVQFHPTAILSQSAGLGASMPLATEALRGEGAILVNGRGERFMDEVPGRELAPRDVVARAIEAQIAAGQPVFLDTRAALGARIATRFPAVMALCQAGGIDPVSQPIPIRPAAHYHMGGVAVDARGRTSVEGLWACGEVSATGLHGANRLASNSLLEALAYARWIARDLAASTVPARAPVVAPLSAVAPLQKADADAAMVLRRLMSARVGVIRDEENLRQAIVTLDGLAASRVGSTLGDMALVGLMIATGALARQESRGAQYRSDFTQCLPEGKHSMFDFDEVRRRAAAVCADAPELRAASNATRRDAVRA